MVKWKNTSKLTLEVHGARQAGKTSHVVFGIEPMYFVGKLERKLGLKLKQVKIKLVLAVLC